MSTSDPSRVLVKSTLDLEPRRSDDQTLCMGEIDSIASVGKFSGSVFKFSFRIDNGQIFDQEHHLRC